MAEQMLITQALNELKVLDARISRTIEKADFVRAAKKSDSKIVPGTTKEQFAKDAQSSYDSIQDLIKRRRSIKSAIVKSNAVTMIEICGEQITVAEAIDLKTSIEYQKLLLDQMKEQRGKCALEVSRNNADMERKIDQMLMNYYGKDGKEKANPDEQKNITEPYRNANEYEPFDPLKIEGKIEKLESYIEDFESNIDSKLQISNCVTTIEI